MAEYINKAELMNERPEWLNKNMLSKEKSAHNQGWNECNDEWLNIIKAMPTIEIPEEPHFETEAEGIAYLVGAFSVALGKENEDELVSENSKNNLNV